MRYGRAAEMAGMVEVARIAMSPGTEAQRAEALLAALRTVIRYDVGSIALYDPERRGRFALASTGDSDALHAYSESPEGDAELDGLGLNGPRPPMLHSELPVPLLDTLAWSEYLWPAGFRGSIGVGLFAPGGRHVGHVTLLAESPSGLTTVERDTLGSLTPLIAHAVDRLRSISVVSRIVRGATAGVVLTRACNALPLDGLPGHPLLVSHCPVLTVAAGRLACGDTHATFLCPSPDGGAPDAFVRVTVLDCAGGRLDHLLGLVVLCPPGNLRGLDRTDLRILGVLAEGWPNSRIAEVVGLTRSAVDDRIARIVETLDAPGITGAAVLAVRDGLYIPPPLAEPPD